MDSLEDKKDFKSNKKNIRYSKHKRNSNLYYIYSKNKTN